MPEAPTTRETLEPQERRALLQQETEHYFQAELYHDQRASWLLTLSTALLTIVLGALIAINENKLGKAGQVLFTIAGATFGVSILLSLFALWPLAGRNAKCWKPFASACDVVREQSIEEHYLAHRRRAARKADRIVLVLISLIVGMILFFAGALLSIRG
jgi:hypothetical protein